MAQLLNIIFVVLIGSGLLSIVAQMGLIFTLTRLWQSRSCWNKGPGWL